MTDEQLMQFKTKFDAFIHEATAEMPWLRGVLAVCDVELRPGDQIRPTWTWIRRDAQQPMGTVEATSVQVQLLYATHAVHTLIVESCKSTLAHVAALHTAAHQAEQQTSSTPTE